MEQHENIKREVKNLHDNLFSYSVDVLEAQCLSLEKAHQDIMQLDVEIHDLLQLIGPEMLNDQSVGEYQRSLREAIVEIEEISSKMKIRKLHLVQTVSRNIGKKLSIHA